MISSPFFQLPMKRCKTKEAAPSWERLPLFLSQGCKAGILDAIRPGLKSNQESDPEMANGFEPAGGGCPSKTQAAALSSSGSGTRARVRPPRTKRMMMLKTPMRESPVTWATTAKRKGPRKVANLPKML